MFPGWVVGWGEATHKSLVKRRTQSQAVVGNTVLEGQSEYSGGLVQVSQEIMGGDEVRPESEDAGCYSEAPILSS